MPRRSIWKGSFVDAFHLRNLKEFKFDLFPISQNFLFFLSIGFILAFFFSFVIVYFTMFPGKDPQILPNLLQVIAQLSCFFFFFFYNKRGDVRQRHLCLLILFCSIVSSLYLQGIEIAFLFFFFFFIRC